MTCTVSITFNLSINIQVRKLTITLKNTMNMIVNFSSQTLSVLTKLQEDGVICIPPDIPRSHSEDSNPILVEDIFLFIYKILIDPRLDICIEESIPIRGFQEGFPYLLHLSTVTNHMDARLVDLHTWHMLELVMPFLSLHMFVRSLSLATSYKYDFILWGSC